VPNTNQSLDHARAWVESHTIQGGGIATTSRQIIPYPEVTGYLIPSLIKSGDRERAVQYARWLSTVQREDGSFFAPGSDLGFVFDTGQVVRGLVSLCPELPELEPTLRKACAWLVKSADPATSRLPTPTPGGAWRLGERGEVSEAVHLYVLAPLITAARFLGSRPWEDLAYTSLEFYKRHFELTRFDQRTMLTHLYCYIQQALVELGEIELARKGMASLATYQQDNGALPAYSDVQWICTPGQIQAAIVWYTLGERERADKAIAFAEELMNPSGGFYGSYGVGAEYFPAEEPSWAVKFFIDACLLRDQPATASPISRETSPGALGEQQWYDAITNGSTPDHVCERVRQGMVPEWAVPLLDESQPGEVLLELGSGTGELSAYLATQGRNVILLDYGQECLEFSREVFRRLGLNATYIHADIRNTFPLPDRHVDIVWSSGVLEHFSDDEILHILRESRRVSRRRVISLVPNAASFAYRLGKWDQERSGKWMYGYEDPKFSLAGLYEAAGFKGIHEWSIAAEHATRFLVDPELQPAAASLREFFHSLGTEQLAKLNQGYLLVTSALSHEPRRLVVVPNDPLRAYADAGYPDLTEYFNPRHFFDEVFCLSPHETSPGDMYGMKVIPTRREEFAKKVNAIHADVVRAYDLPAGHFACAPDLEAPVVVSVHDVNPQRVPDYPPPADRFLAISSAVEQFLQKMGTDAERITRFANRVDMSVFQPIDDSARRAEFQQCYPGRYRILHVGRIDRQKNQETVIRALPLLGPEYTAIFVGKGDVGQLQHLAASLHVENQCCFVEAVENCDLPYYYSFADCMCTPSRWEGFGIVFIEALACEAVVVTSDIPPMNEYIHHEENGLLVREVDNPSLLAAMVQRACTDGGIRQKIKSSARHSVERFSKEEVDRREVDIYRSILHDRRTHTPPSGRDTGNCAGHDRPLCQESTHLEIVPLTADLSEEWESVVRSSPDAWLYHSFDEQLLLEEAWGVETHSFLVATRGVPVAIVPLQRHRKNAFLDSTAMGPGGPALVNGLTSQEVDEILSTVFQHIRATLQRLKSSGIQGAHIFLPPQSYRSLEHWQTKDHPLLRFGLEDISTQTAIIDFDGKTLDNVFRDVRENHRRGIRNAQKAGVVVVPSVTSADVDEYYRLHIETYQRTGVPPHPVEYFRGIEKYFVSTGRAMMLFAVFNGQPIAAMNIANFKETALYWTGANAAEGLRLGAGKLLMWEAIERAYLLGLRWFEVGEVFVDSKAGTKHAGLTMHKSGYGGELHPFHKGLLRV
jgi:glycosyltransferase involved in cell wall biosynthesis